MKNETTAKRLQIALSNANMKQQELADKSGLNKASISQYINGYNSPSNISSGKMAKILNVNPMWLMGFDVSAEPKTFNISEAENDFELVGKYSLLGEADRKIVMNLINSLLEKEG